MKIFIDPPSGWQYGFPKIYDTAKDGDINQWMVKEGYPQEEIDRLGKSFYFRSWEANEQDDSFQQGVITKKG